MNLDKVSEEDKVNICRRYFIVGCFLLPFIWLVNSVWFFKEAFIKKNGHPMIRRYVGGSIIGTLTWTAVLIAWTCIYQTQRPFWGVFGDYISVIVPNGRP